MADRNSEFHEERGFRNSLVVRFGGGAVTLGAGLALLYASGFLLAGIAGGLYFRTLLSSDLGGLFFGFGVILLTVVPLLSLLAIAIALVGLASNIQPFVVGIWRLLGRPHNIWSCMIVTGTLINVGLAGLLGWLVSWLHDPVPYVVTMVLIFLAPEFLKHLGFWLIRAEQRRSEPPPASRT